MNVHRMFTAFNQSCVVYFIFSNLLLYKIIHIFNLIFSFNFFINQVIKIFATHLLFTLEIESNFKSVLFTSSFSCIFITEILVLFQVSALILTILYIRKKKINFFWWHKILNSLDCFSFNFYFYFFYFLFFIFFIFYFPFFYLFKSLILHCSISSFHILHFYFLNCLAAFHIYLFHLKL